MSLPGDLSNVMVIQGSRIACPKCKNSSKNMMREVEDRSHIVSDYPLIYGKKIICGKCGQHFRKAD